MPGVKKADGSGKYDSLIEKHAKSLEWMRKEFMEMDSQIDPVMGIASWDDAAAIKFGEKTLVASVDGPYTKRLVMRSAMIHAATDVAVKGARPLFALDTLTGGLEDIREMVSSLKEQALAMKIPILGGNTMPDPDSEPRCSLTVIGELILDKPIRDCGACTGDMIALIGDPIWGSRVDRINKAKTLFEAWYAILEEGVDIHASKDVTKGGLICAAYEICKKSGQEHELYPNIPFSLTRNLDNFLVFAQEKECKKMQAICKNIGAGFYTVGRVI